MKYSLTQPGMSQLRDSIKLGAKNQQSKRQVSVQINVCKYSLVHEWVFLGVNIWCVLQLLESRSRVIQTDAERELWQTAILDPMSDEEDAMVDGRPVLVVNSPPHRNPLLSELCQQLQSKLEADMHYALTHHQHVRADGIRPEDSFL